LEECPKCGKWTLTYNPKTEFKFCISCNYKEHLKYELFVEQTNIIDNLSYPNHERKHLKKIEA
jgi:hypothetical protein